ncbi:E3 ubiquitin-protein ligase SINA-like 10 [Orchesella cincta]|uniref:E3 ubiquitin-protein ligase SINA-like 10 n=1 Tax=Orchesella cincta TaxID=48709 RepID=A0A1D2M2I1_ORCCI|nr:E3 ubiquitin-protein ligase SINA-like 10 [Orchesella cincta]
MENFRTCPICSEVPEQEIFQCRVGHVICNLCIVKLNTGFCPQCRVPFGTVRIRNRLLKKCLTVKNLTVNSRKEVVPKFANVEGFTHVNSVLYKRGSLPPVHLEISTRSTHLSRNLPCHHHHHAHSSSSALPTNKYNPFPFCGSMRVGGIKDVQTLLKASTINFPISLLEDHQFGVNKDYLQAKVTPLPAVANIPSVLSGSGPLRSAFPNRGSMKVSGLEEAHYLSKSSPINVSMRLLQDSKFGEDEDDFLNVNISRISDI